MTRRKDPIDPGLFALTAYRRGRVERSVDAAVRAARADKALASTDVALITLARSQARAVDLAEAARDVWAHARAGGELRDTLIRLRLDPVSRGVGRDSIADFLRSLTEPATVHQTGPAPLSDTPVMGPADVRADGGPVGDGVGMAADAMATRRRRRRVGDRPDHG